VAFYLGRHLGLLRGLTDVEGRRSSGVGNIVLVVVHVWLPLQRRNIMALVTTLTLLNAIAAPATIVL